MHTPWGKSHTKTKLAPGIYWVSTASHGGAMLSLKAAQQLSEPARKAGIPCGNYLAYEEDCAFHVLAWEMPELFNVPGSSVPSREVSRRALSLYQPEYLLAKGDNVDAEAYAQWQARQTADQMRADRQPDLIVSAVFSELGRTPGTWPPPLTEVTTADGKKHLVKAGSYKPNTPNLLSCCEVVDPESINA